MEMPHSNSFARVGMSHVTEHLGDPWVQRMEGLDGIRINTSSQPNSNPHFGTLTTMMCVAATGEELSGFYDKPVMITFDQLENAPDRKDKGIISREVNGQKTEYQISLKDSIDENGVSQAEKNMKIFRFLFGLLEEQTGISFDIRTYQECQADPEFRRSLLKIFNEAEKFKPIVAPADNTIRIRFPCPDCHWVDKGSVNTHIIEQSEEEIIFDALCPDHGHHQSVLSVDSEDFFDTNTPLRDIAKVPGLVRAGQLDNLMPLMIDGRDWSGRWDRCVHLLGTSALGVNTENLPARIYTPVVTDMLGAKLSKSLYVGDMYAQMPKGFADFSHFMQEYGRVGLNTLWEHVRQWPKDPAYIDRDSYTITYFMLLLSGKLDNANIMG